MTSKRAATEAPRPRYSQKPSAVPVVEVMCLQLVPATQRPFGSVSQRDGPVPPSLGLPDTFAAVDLLTDTTFRWRTGRNFVGLAAGGAHVITVGPAEGLKPKRGKP